MKNYRVMRDFRVKNVLEEANLYLRGDEKECSVTGQEIGKENWIEIYPYFTFSKKGIENIIQQDIDDDTSHHYDINTWKRKDKCGVCNKLGKCNILTITKEETNTYEIICDYCLSVCKRMCEGKNPVHYINDYFIILNLPEGTKKYDSLESGIRIENSYLIRLVFSNNTGMSIQTKLGNIRELINTLRDNEYHDSTHIKNSQGKCCICSNTKDNLMNIFVGDICGECRKKTSESLEKYLNRNENFVLSNII